MTEKEKMLAGMIYDANYDKDLMQERLKCKDLCYEFNQLRPSRIEEQTRLIRDQRILLCIVTLLVRLRI